MNKSLSNVHPDARIGKGVVIEPFATIQGDVIIGDGTWIGPNAVVMDGARIGKNCQIHPCAIISGIPQDLKFVGEYSTAEIGENTSIREFATVHRGTNSKGKTVIGDHCLIMAYAHVAHDSFLRNHCIMGSYAGLAGEVEMDDYAILSAGSLVHQFVRIGCHVMIQGGSKVTKDVPPYALAGRDPLKYAGINSVGLRRRGFSGETINQILEIYRIIYQNSMNVSQSLAYIETNIPPTPERDIIINFIRNSFFNT
ncbi:MAG: acyl-ACP--UDP-N-acetylglucosamine O-acyltransferase, partial [Bacteroidales bacterium]|nr:acyl-ACP--UDP-N-acetylglucosamine O-acyltransferase [Bacteroidales bacterium]